MDPEIGIVRDGYPALAKWMAGDPDREAFVFRRFDCLATRNILHLQAKLIALEHKIKRQDEEAHPQEGADFKARESSRRYETLRKCATDDTRKEKERVESLEEMGELLKEYYEILVLQSQIGEMRKPSDRILLAFREYVKGTAFQDKDGEPMPLISGRAKTFLDDKTDLLTTAKPSEEDILSRVLQNHWQPRKRKTDIKREMGDPLDRTMVYKNLHIVRTVAVVGMMLTAILLIGAIVTLYLVPDPKAKLGLVAMYTMLFALSLAMCTNARRAEVFAATAAYAAVLVVFVSGDLGGTKTAQCLIQLEGAIWKTVECPG